MLCGTDIIISNIVGYSHIQYEYRKYEGILHGILSAPQHIVMNLRNVMTLNRNIQYNFG